MMRKHYDHIHSIFDGQMKGVPIVSIVANLNEDYEGSEFYCRDEKIELKTGDILLFPSNFMYPHEVRETTKRHPILVCKLGFLIYNEAICYKR